MSQAPSRRPIGLGALVILGALTGFLLATSVSGAEYATLGTIEGDDRAYAVPVSEDVGRLRFQLDATRSQASAQISIFDPQDDFVASHKLSANGDRTNVVTDEPGRWVVFVHQAEGSSLLVETSRDAGASPPELTELPVDRDTRSLLREDGGKVHQQVVHKVDSRPAGLALDWSGHVSGLEAILTSEQGTVDRVHGGNANGSDRSQTTRRQDPGNIIPGRFEASIEADHLDGEVSLVRFDYIRSPVTLEGATKQAQLEAARNGTIVARMQDGQAYAIDTVRASKILFWTNPDAHAHVRVFTDEDRFVNELALGRHEGTCPSGCWSTVEGESSRIAQFVDLAEPDTYVAYVSSVGEPNTTVSVAIPNVEEAPVASQLSVVEAEMTFETQLGQTHTKETRTLQGALVEARVDTEAKASSHRNVTIEGPLGVALRYEETASASEGSLYTASRSHVDRYTSGEFTAHVNTDWTARGSTTVRLTSYER